MNLSGNQALVGTGYLTENNFGCLGYIFLIGEYHSEGVFIEITMDVDVVIESAKVNGVNLVKVSDKRHILVYLLSEFD